MGDALKDLPTDPNIKNTGEELEVIKMLSSNPVVESSGQSSSVKEKPGVLSELLNVVVIGVLFAVIASDFFGNLIVKIIPSAETWYYKLLIRTILFVAVYFLVTNFALSRKCDA